MTPTFMCSNNNSTVNSLMTTWVIIQILAFFILYNDYYRVHYTTKIIGRNETDSRN